MIRLILLTGFLGAGKTTLLKSLLEHYRETPVGLIVNDFGEVNIDARLLEKDGITLAELQNGSIFCSCIKENFMRALIELSSLNIEYLFIEASGLADPGNMEQILSAIQSRLSRRYDYRGSVCILDGESFLDMFPMLPAVGNQLTYAGAVLVNKEELIAPGDKP
jgi:G3E family GTPase